TPKQQPENKEHTILALSELNTQLQQRVSSQQQQLYTCTFVALAMLALLLGSVLYPLIETQTTHPPVIVPDLGDESQMLYCNDEAL
ncbi:hypothetical protein, partial [Klebsiella pneumoniae]|uniref:hypothetical protein n=1 Tax=Klebsiella pneumoniae TaxID=573 RepID=UPI00273211CB